VGDDHHRRQHMARVPRRAVTLLLLTIIIACG
jgi:hypothetical protein